MGNIEKRAWMVMDALVMMKYLSMQEMQVILGKEFFDIGEVILWLAARRMIDCRLVGDQIVVKLSEQERTTQEAPARLLETLALGSGRA